MSKRPCLSTGAVVSSRAAYCSGMDQPAVPMSCKQHRQHEVRRNDPPDRAGRRSSLRGPTPRVRIVGLPHVAGAVRRIGGPRHFIRFGHRDVRPMVGRQRGRSLCSRIHGLSVPVAISEIAPRTITFAKTRIYWQHCRPRFPTYRRR